MARGSRVRAGWQWLFALCAASSLACGEEGQAQPNLDSHVGEFGTQGTTCEGEAVPDLPSGHFADIEWGDLQIVHSSENQTSERSLLTGELTPLFELRRLDKVVALDERDLFAADIDNIHRLDRSSRELSLFASEAAPSDYPVPATRLIRRSLAVSPTYVVALVVGRPAGEAGDTYPDYLLEVIGRASGDRRYVRMDQPISTGKLLAQGERFFLLRTVELPSETGSREYESDILALDLEAGTSEPILQSYRGSPYRPNIELWSDFLLFTEAGEGTHRNLLSVPLSGGEPQVIATELEASAFAVSGSEAFVLQHDGTLHGRLTAFDLGTGSKRTFGTCDGAPVHGSNSHVYVYHRPLEILRLTP